MQYYIHHAQSKIDTSIIDQSMREYPENMKAENVTELLNVDLKTIRNWTNTKKILFVKLGTSVRHPESKIETARERGEIGRKKKKID